VTVGLDALLAALADATRRAVVLRLAHGPATTSQLAELRPISRPATSKHIKVLQDVGLLRTETVGRHRWHTLDRGALTVLEEWLQLVTKIVTDAPALRRDPGGPPP
jgi:DNA-binding transcriptional ArsR family regulator